MKGRIPKPLRLMATGFLLLAGVLAGAVLPPDGAAETRTGTIAGRVSFVGVLPSPQTVSTGRFSSYCGESLKFERLVVGKTRGLKNVVVMLEGNLSPATVPANGAPRTLTNRKCRFTPHVQVVPAGAEVDLRNDDAVLHNFHIHGPEGETLLNIALSRQGQSYRWRGPKKAVNEVMCHAGHTWMSGYILTAPNRYYAVTDGAGEFHINDVPPGAYVLKAWHEGWKSTGRDKFDRRPLYRSVVLRKRVTIRAEKETWINFDFSD